MDPAANRSHSKIILQLTFSHNFDNLGKMELVLENLQLLTFSQDEICNLNNTTTLVIIFLI